jgi:Uma2 family endonuclease
MASSHLGDRLVQTSLEIPVDVPVPPAGMIEEDGAPMESEWHRMEIALLIESVRSNWRSRTDFYAGGNCFIYFNEEQVRNRDYRGPDFFFVWDVPSTPIRPYWAVWREGGRYPDAIIELLSPTTADVDRTVKKALYERVFRTRNYFCYDPASQLLEGWVLSSEGYASLTPDASGRLYSAVLGLSLGTWLGEYQGYHDTWLRFFTPAGTVVPTLHEADQAEIARLRTELEQHRSSKP